MFSLNDVKSSIAGEGYEVRAVTRDGRFVSLKKGQDEINPSLGDEMEKFVPQNAKLFLSADNRAIQKYGKKRTAEQIMREAENITNEWLLEYASSYGYIFTKGEI